MNFGFVIRKVEQSISISLSTYLIHILEFKHINIVS